MQQTLKKRQILSKILYRPVRFPPSRKRLVASVLTLFALNEQAELHQD